MKRLKQFSGYMITNIKTKKKYIGITSNTIKQRFSGHIRDSSNNKIRYKNHLHNSIRRHGKEFFKIELIIKKNTWEEICEWEIFAIKEYNTKTPNGYNLTNGGEGAFGLKRTDETNKKLSKIKIEFYKDQKNRDEQRERSKRNWDNKELRENQYKRSKKLWEDSDYREKTIQKIQEAWDSGLFNEKHKIALRKATIENPEWIKKNNEQTSKQASDPEWRKRVKEGIRKRLSNPELAKIDSENISRITKKYWDEGHDERRKEHSKAMSKMIRKNLQDPSYQKWRKNNPPGGKPIQYNHKFFRSIQEAADTFNVNRATVDRHILQNKPGCKKLKSLRRKNWPWEIKHD